MAVISDHPNAQVLADFFAAFGAADRARMAELMVPGCPYHFPGDSPISGEFSGPDGVLTGIRRIALALGQGHHGFELLRIMADDEMAISVHRDFATDEDPFELLFALFVRMEDGRMAEVWEVPFDQRASDAYWSRRAAALAISASA